MVWFECRFRRPHRRRGGEAYSLPEGTNDKEVRMKINFRHDVEQVLQDAKSQRKPVLLDFSAAPM
jgi:hypothetical protein